MQNLFVFIFGAIVGSFLNVCIYRLPKKLSVVKPRSFCPACSKKIAWYDNIPLVSFAVLMARCRSCRAKIPVRYFLVELITASLGLLLFLAFGMSARFFAYFILTAGLIIATFVDFEIQEIPDEVSILGIVIGLAASLIAPSIFGTDSVLASARSSFIGALAGGMSIYLMGFFGEMVFKKEAMGGGDVKLLAMIGAFLGWKLAIFVFFTAPLFGAIVGVIQKVKYKRETIPYGPYLSLAAVVAVFWGDRIIQLFFYNTF